jgi:hypothetical protein
MEDNSTIVKRELEEANERTKRGLEARL